MTPALTLRQAFPSLVVIAALLMSLGVWQMTLPAEVRGRWLFDEATYRRELAERNAPLALAYDRARSTNDRPWMTDVEIGRFTIHQLRERPVRVFTSLYGWRHRPLNCDCPTLLGAIGRRGPSSPGLNASLSLRFEPRGERLYLHIDEAHAVGPFPFVRP